MRRSPMRVVAVSRDPERAALLDPLLDPLLVDANDYDVIVLESLTHGYSRDLPDFFGPSVTGESSASNKWSQT